jgi:hypothetical protein
VVASPVLSVRSPSIEKQVAATPHSAYIVYAGDIYDRRFGAALRAAGIGFQRTVVGDYAVYVLDRRSPPDQYQDIWLLSP